MTAPRKRTPPAAGVVRVSYEPGRLPRASDAVGPNRFDDPRPNSRDRFLIRYAATSLRGCLLELLAAFRPNDEAAELEQTVATDDGQAKPDTDEQLRSALAAYLAGRRVATLKTPRRTQFLSIDDAVLQAELDREPAVRALLDSAEGRAALALPDGRDRPRLDGAAVRLSTSFGRDLSQHCALAIRDRTPTPGGIHYRSRHDDAEDCWAIYDHVDVMISGNSLLDPGDPAHRDTLRAVAGLWLLPLPSQWQR